MAENRRQMTLIMLRPDGRNRTYALTRRRLAWLIASGGLLVVVIGILVYTTIRQRVDLRRLWNEHQLLIGREVVSMSPRPLSAEDVPGAVEVPEGVMVQGGTAGAGGEQAQSGSEPSAGEMSRPLGTRPGAPPAGEAPVRFEGFQLLRLESGDGWRLQVQLTKSEWNNEVQNGFVVVLIEDAKRPGRFFTQPPVTVANSRPLSPQAGDSFSIRRLKPLLYEFSLPEGFAMREVRILVYDRSGTLLLERSFQVEGS